jgi:hypothetical protein
MLHLRHWSGSSEAAFTSLILEAKRLGARGLNLHGLRLDLGSYRLLRELPKLEYVAMPDCCSGIPSAGWFMEGPRICGWPPCDEALRQLKPDRLLGLDLTGWRFTKGGLRPLAAARRLRALSLFGARVGSDDLAPIAELKSLRVLHLDSTRVGDAGLVHVAKLRNLRELTLNGTPITDAGLVHLAELRELRVLSLPGATSDAGLARLAPLRNLEVLRVGVGITGRGFGALCRGAPLKRLDWIARQTLTPEGMAGLAACRELRVLELLGEVTDQSLRPLLGLHELRELSLGFDLVSPDALAGLARLPHLERLSALGVCRGPPPPPPPHSQPGGAPQSQPRHMVPPSTTCGDAAAEALARNAGLKFINLTGAPVSDAGLAPLGRLTRLRRLVLSQAPIDGTGFGALAELPTLDELDLSSTKLTDTGLAQVARLKHLRRLDVAHTRVTEAGIFGLLRLSELTYLRVGNLPLTPQTLAALRANGRREVAQW